MITSAQRPRQDSDDESGELSSLHFDAIECYGFVPIAYDDWGTLTNLAHRCTSGPYTPGLECDRQDGRNVRHAASSKVPSAKRPQIKEHDLALMQ